MLIGDSLKQKIWQGNNNSVPVLQSFVVRGDTVQAKFSLPAKEIDVIGQNGGLLYHEINTNTISFVFDKNTPYARVVATFGNGTSLLLNPVFRYQQSPLEQTDATINTIQTLLWRTVGVLLLSFWFIFVAKKFFLQKQKR